jgi:pyridinium-3,5-bisthiocarboxylic acid mononucleotide nickel chelatase
MRIAYLDCFAGISGDMFLAALLDAGVDRSVLENAAAAMNLNATLKVETVDRSGISSTKVHVLENGKLADAPASQEPEQAPNHDHSHDHSHPHHHNPDHSHPHDDGLSQSDSHDQDHENAHEHVHGRSLTVIRQLIQDSSLATPVKHTAIRAFELLGASEARIHNVPVEEIHFHEVGAVDAIIDIVAVSAGIHALGADQWVASPINVGGGTVACAHGRFPVPAPATADLLRGIPTYSAHVQKELVTPTGAALLRALVEEKGLTFASQPAMRVQKIGYGAGTRNPRDFPNVLRLSVGETEATDPTDTLVPTDIRVPNDSRVPHSSQSHRDGWEEDRQHSQDVQGANSARHPHHDDSNTVTVLETALDDLSPQVIAYVTEAALERGALDVMLTPVLMKKNRPGTLLTVLCNPADSAALEQLLLRETSTLGLRIRQDRRLCLDRAHTTVQTAYGAIRIKLGTRAAHISTETGTPEILNANPEFEDCRAAARAHNVPLKQVQQAALAAWHNTQPNPDTKAHTETHG